MPGQQRPNPCFLDGMEKYGVRGISQVWISPDRKRLYTWDFTHEEIEAYNRRGKHLGSLDAITGQFVKPAVKGRSIDV